MNGIVSLLGIESWKPVLSALLLPPVPPLLAILIGLWLMRRHRRAATWLVAASVIAVWLLACSGFARGLETLLLGATPPMGAARLAELRAQVASSPGESPVAIVVLGGGAEPYAPEYDSGSLEAASLERLRYGLWLARRTGCPVAFSGGLGWAGRPSVPEANLAQRIATEDFRQPLRWLDNTAADKRNTLMQISVWATTRAQATLLAHQIEEAMCASDDFTATPQGEPISTHDAETNLYGAVQRYSIYSLR